MVAEALTPNADDEPREDHVVVLRGISWADYLRVLRMRGDRSAPRISYEEGLLEIMSPSSSHENIKSLIGRLVEAYCFERDIEFTTVGSWTVKDRRKKVGAEPDECWVFGPLGKVRRPDLAIEVVWTPSAMDKLDIYRALGVKEVWYWRKGAITAHVLDRGRYRELTTSRVLPDIDLAELSRFLKRPTTSAAIRGYRDALRARG